jgi:hypothetical protein
MLILYITLIIYFFKKVVKSDGRTLNSDLIQIMNQEDIQTVLNSISGELRKDMQEVKKSIDSLGKKIEESRSEWILWMSEYKVWKPLLRRKWEILLNKTEIDPTKKSLGIFKREIKTNRKIQVISI